VLRARTIILACGVTWRQLAIEGFERLVGKGISYGAARSEAPNTHGLDVHVIGAGNSAGQAALFFATHARSVTVLCRGEGLEKSMSRYLIDPREIASGQTNRVGSSGLFIFIGADAETEWLPPEIALDRLGYVLTGPEMRAASEWSLDRDPFLLETSVPGTFACGDVRSGPVKRVAAAVGEGSMSIAFVHQYLRELEAAAAAAPAPNAPS
jgi:thioredoxin reductase (NADPH)